MNIKWKYKNVLSGVLLAILTASIVITSFYSQYNVNPTEQFVWEPDYPSAGSSCLFEISNNVETPFGTYSPNMLNYTPSIPIIELPEDLYEIENYYRIVSEVSNESLDFFNEYGFVTTYGYANDIYAYYDVEKNAWGEMYVTTDLCLHTFHTLYDVYLRILEGEHFYNDLEIMLKTLREDQFIRNSSFTDVNVINAMNKNVAYLSTMLKLLNDSNTIPIEVQSMVESELTKINTSIPAYSSIFGYDEDYSQYKVRGHYTRNEILSRYFQAMMYAGRMGFLVQNPSLSTEMSIEQTRMAMLLISSFNATVESETVWNLWENITKPISFFVGVSDDLTAYDYYEVWENFGTPDGNSLANDTLIELMIEDLKAYPSPRINSMILGALENPQSYTRGFRLMGQSFIPDSYIFQQLVEPNILSRTIPTALDIFSVFGSPRAEHYLQSVNETYPEYSETVMNLREEFGDFNEEDWTTNLYSLWIYSLFPLLQPVEMGYPQYMLNDSWTDKALMTASGSWTELRHDSILYSKASVTFLSLDDGLGYIEAYPEVYSRLSSLVELMINGLEGMGLLNTDFSDRLNYLQAIFTRLANVSIKLLENQVINSSDRYFIKIVGGELEDLTKFLNPEYQQWISTTDQRMAIVADVHTDPSSSQVLEVATGNPYVIYVLVQDHNGNYRVVKGATYSFYEFLQPMTERLTDEEWHVILYSNPPDPPFWIQYSLQIVIPEIHPRTVTLAVLTINLPKQKVANLNFKIEFNKWHLYKLNSERHSSNHIISTEMHRMNETTDQTDDFILDHPTTLKIYLYMKAKAPKEVSIREAQRVLEVKSTSTVSWHLTKLEDAGYAEKLPTNKYKLTAKAEKKQEIKIPVVIPAQLIRGVIIPRNLLLLSFLLVAAVISFILIWVNPLLSSILGIVFIVIALALGIFEYSFLRKQLRFYRFLSEENSSQKKEED